MKKLIAKLVTFVLATTMVLTVFTACDWVTTNADRDMDQVIASVNIDESQLNDTKIYKRELVSNYVTYGYQYVMSYGYTVSDTYQLLLDNLVNNEVILQYARIQLADTYKAIAKNEADRTEFENLFYNDNHVEGGEIVLKYSDNGRSIDSNYIKNLKQYLTAYEYASVLYSSKVYINSMIDSYEDAEKDEEEDPVEDVTYTARAVPTVEEDPSMTEVELKTHAPDKDELAIAGLTLSEDELAAITNVYDLNMKVYEKYAIDFSSTSDRKQAYSQVLTSLKDSGLINSKASFDVNANANDVFKYEFFYNVLAERMESAVITKYENSLKGAAEADIESGLWAQYKKEYEAQEALYKNDNAAYETALESASDTSFVLYNPSRVVGSTYGYVANLLIGFNEAQSALLTAKQGEKGITQKEVDAYRATLLNNLVATDQRATWVQSSYGDYDKDGNSFIFGEDYRTSALDSIKNFIGSVEVVDADGRKEEDANGVENTVWSFKSVTPTEIAYNDFYTTYVAPVLGEEKIFVDGDANTIGKVASYGDETFAKFEDLMFAFSTDTGCLNKEYGYLYSPVTSATTYVKEFAAAAKAVVDAAVTQGVGTYTVVATDFGYHIILCTKLVTDPYDVASGEDAFKGDLDTVGTLAYNYKNVKIDSVVSTRINKIVQTEINPYLEGGEKCAITFFEKTYSDLIVEEEETSDSHNH